MGTKENLNTLLLDLKTNMKKSKHQDRDSRTITPSLSQTVGLGVSFSMSYMISDVILTMASIYPFIKIYFFVSV